MSFIYFESADAEKMAARNAEYVADIKSYVSMFMDRLTSPKNARLYNELSKYNGSVNLSADGLTIVLPVVDIDKCRRLPLADKIILTGGYHVIGLHGVKHVPVDTCLYPCDEGIPLEKAAQLIVDLSAITEFDDVPAADEHVRKTDLHATVDSLQTGKNFFILPPADTDKKGHYGCLITDGKSGFAIPDLFADAGARILPLTEVNMKAVKEDALNIDAPVEMVLKGAVCKALEDLHTIACDIEQGACEVRAHHYLDQDIAVALVSTKHNLALRTPSFYTNSQIMELMTRDHVAIAENVWHSVALPNLDQAAHLAVDAYLKRVVDAYNHVFNKQEKRNGKN
jgi:hypothetical protein